MSYKALFAIASALDLEIEQLDVRTAFLYGNIDEEILCQQDHGQEDDTARVCQLNKAPYGLKQAPRIWYLTLPIFLNELGFLPLSADLAVFSREHTFIAVYVDDMLMVGPSAQQIGEIKQALGNRFSMSDLGSCHYYLGMSVRRDRPHRVLFLGQRGYVEKILRDFGMWEAKSAATPMDTTKLENPEEGYVCSSEDKNWRAIGSLMYAMLGTRVDIAFSVSVLSRQLANPGPAHIKAVKRIMRYLKGISHLELVFRGTLKPLTGYSDADWAGDLETRRSTSGFLFNIGSGAISWSSKRQPTVSLSTCEAEYIAQTQATKEAIWLRSLLSQLLLDENEPSATIIFGDKQGAIALAKNPQFHARTKHIAIQHHFVREQQGADR